MIRYLKKNKLHIYLLVVIAGLALLPLLQNAVLPDAELSRKGIAVLLNLTTTVISYCCFTILFGNNMIGVAGSALYTWCPLRCSTLYVSAGWEESLAWCFVPIVLLGMVRLYKDSAEGFAVEAAKGTKEKNSAWMTLSLGLVLLAVSALTFFSVAVGAVVLWFLVMGKQSFCKQRVICVGKTILATGLLGGWFLVKPLLALRDPTVAGSLIPENFRMSGFYFAQYLSLFPTEGSGTNSAVGGAIGSMEMGMGAAVVLLVLLYLWSMFVKKFEDSLGKRMLIFTGILLWLGSNLFPWDLLQNKNMLFSVVLAIFQTPTNWAVFAYVGLIWVACRMLQKLIQGKDIAFPKLEIALPDRLMVLIFALSASLPLMVSYNIVGEELLWYLLKAQELLGFSVDGMYPLFVLLVNLGTAGIAYISFRKCFKDCAIGVLASGLYLLSPYRLYLLYNRSAVAEYVALMFLPLILWGVYGICRTEDKRLWNGIRLAVGGVGSICFYGIGYVVGKANDMSVTTTFAITNVDFALLLCVLLWIGLQLKDDRKGMSKDQKHETLVANVALLIGIILMIISPALMGLTILCILPAVAAMSKQLLATKTNSISGKTLIYVLIIITLILGTYQVNEILRSSGNLMFI